MGSYCFAVDMKGALDATASSCHCKTEAHGSVKPTILDLMRPRNFGGFFYIYGEMNCGPIGHAIKNGARV